MPIRMTGMASGIDVDAVVKELMSAQKLKKTNLEGKKEKLSWKQDAWKDMNKKLYSFYTGSLSKMKTQGNYQARKATASDTSKVSVSATTATAGSYSLKVEQLASAEYITGGDIKSKGLSSISKLTDAGMELGQTITIKTGKNLDNEFTFTVGEESTISDFTSKLKEAGLSANFDSNSGRFYISAKNSGTDGLFTIESNVTGDTGLAAIGLTNITEELAKGGHNASTTSDFAIVKAQDAKIRLNGAIIESGSNTINVNGMKLDLLGTTGDEEVNISVTKDSQAVVDRVKDFIKGYNELMTQMYEKYNAASARNYSMLTSDQKEAMSEDEVGLGGGKIRDSL